MIFPDLPIELQTEIATYLDTPSLCFFARTSWRSLRMVQSHLIRRQQQLLHSPTIKLVASGGRFFCHTSNAIYACGYNRVGQLGLGHTNDCRIFTRLERQPPGIILQVVPAISHTLVLTDQGLYACGDNSYGRLGLQHANIYTTTFTRLERQPPGVIRQVVARGYHTLVLTDQGLYTCGSNRYGHLGLGHINACAVLTRLPQQPSGAILQVVVGWSHTLVFAEQGLYAFGENSYGQLGLGHTNDCKALTRLPQQPPGVILQVVAGYYHTLVLTDQGLYACGDNSHGQLGVGHINICTTITRLPQQPPGAILQVVAGGYHTLVLTDQGLYVCGSNSHGQLGLGHIKTCMTLMRLPQQPSGVILQMLVGLSHTLILTDQGLYACGDNSCGHLGLEHTKNYITTLTRLSQQPPGVILQVVAGSPYTLVLTDQGLYACGFDRLSQLSLWHTKARTTLTLVDQVPLELRQFQALYRQLNALIRLSQAESLSPKPERLNPGGNFLLKAKKAVTRNLTIWNFFLKEQSFSPKEPHFSQKNAWF